MDIIPQKKTTEDEVKKLEEKAKSVAAEAELMTKKAQFAEQIKKDKLKIKDARKKISEASGGQLGGIFNSLGLGGVSMSKGTKMIIIVVGTVVLFGLMKLMGC